MLQLVALAILVGVALTSIAHERAFVIVDFTASLQELSMKIVSWAMLLAPAAVFGLLAQLCVDAGFEALIGLSVYVGAVFCGLLILVVVYAAIVALAARQNPWRFLRAIRGVQLLAFSTSSSAAVMPLSMKTAEEELGVSPSVSQFVIPVGATVNMDGTALYQVVAAMFLLQVYGIDISGGQLGLLIATTVGASIGAPSTPGVGIVVLASILQSMGMPATGLGMILGVDRILDMVRTAVNVTGDLTACAVMNRWFSPDVAKSDEAEGRCSEAVADTTTAVH
jgi:Na+/H+-dicarboxylate symporter